MIIIIRINDINEKNTQNKLTALHAMKKNPLLAPNFGEDFIEIEGIAMNLWNFINSRLEESQHFLPKTCCYFVKSSG